LIGFKEEEELDMVGIAEKNGKYLWGGAAFLVILLSLRHLNNGFISHNINEIFQELHVLCNM